jgi:HSP90 family molecular chaperone
MMKNNTLEINPQHPVIVKLNEMRKVDAKKASVLSKMVLDNILASAGIPYNLNESSKRNLDVLNDYLNKVTSTPEAKKALEE